MQRWLQVRWLADKVYTAVAAVDAGIVCMSCTAGTTAVTAGAVCSAGTAGTVVAAGAVGAASTAVAGDAVSTDGMRVAAGAADGTAGMAGMAVAADSVSLSSIAGGDEELSLIAHDDCRVAVGHEIHNGVLYYGVWEGVASDVAPSSVPLKKLYVGN